jgi:hypothetical protein
VLPHDGGEFWEVLQDPKLPDARSPISLAKLPNFVPPAQGDEKKQLIYFLDVWERHLSSAEDDSLREVALLGPDTSSRAVITWQIRTLVRTDEINKLLGPPGIAGWPFTQEDQWYVALNLLLRTGARMRARAIGSESTNPCIISPEARYRGTENRLIRVEIHDPGTPGDPKTPARPPTFKWSEDNGSIVYPISRVSGQTIHLGSLGRDARTSICVNDWVEVVDDDVVRGPQVHPLLQVLEVDPAQTSVKLSAAPQGTIGRDPKKRPILRRWASDVTDVEVRGGKPAWIDLGDGVQIEFSTVPSPLARFRPGDYWLIPARTANGTLAWPQDDNVPRDMPPNGIDHHYAPLAVTDAAVFRDLRKSFAYLAGTPKP